MKKVPAVVHVRVSLKDGLTVLDLKPGNTTKLAELRQIIKNNGFVAKEATVVADGTPAADQKQFVVSVTDELLDGLAAPPERVGNQWRFVVRAPVKP